LFCSTPVVVGHTHTHLSERLLYVSQQLGGLGKSQKLFPFSESGHGEAASCLSPSLALLNGPECNHAPMAEATVAYSYWVTVAGSGHAGGTEVDCWIHELWADARVLCV
jgi:hypothetical protein